MNSECSLFLPVDVVCALCLFFFEIYCYLVKIDFVLAKIADTVVVLTPGLYGVDIMAKARSIPIRPDGGDRIAEEDAPSSSSSSDAVDVVRSILESNTSDKAAGAFRSYAGGDGVGVGTPERVLAHYRDMRTFQTVEFHARMSAKYSFDGGKYR